MKMTNVAAMLVAFSLVACSKDAEGAKTDKFGGRGGDPGATSDVPTADVLESFRTKVADLDREAGDVTADADTLNAARRDDVAPALGDVASAKDAAAAMLRKINDSDTPPSSADIAKVAGDYLAAVVTARSTLLRVRVADLEPQVAGIAEKLKSMSDAVKMPIQPLFDDADRALRDAKSMLPRATDPDTDLSPEDLEVVDDRLASTVSKVVAAVAAIK